MLPLGQSFVLASYFSVWKKILRALIENAIFYITFLIIFLCLFVYLVVVKKIIALYVGGGWGGWGGVQTIIMTLE